MKRPRPGPSTSTTASSTAVAVAAFAASWLFAGDDGPSSCSALVFPPARTSVGRRALGLRSSSRRPFVPRSLGSSLEEEVAEADTADDGRRTSRADPGDDGVAAGASGSPFDLVGDDGRPSLPPDSPPGAAPDVVVPTTPGALADFVVVPDAGAAAASTAGSEDRASAAGSLQEVLASPALLDPVAILDATIGSSGAAGSADDARGAPPSAPIDSRASAGAGFRVAEEAVPAPQADDVEAEVPVAASPGAAAAASKEEDLELAHRAITKHIESISADVGVIDDDEDEEEENESGVLAADAETLATSAELEGPASLDLATPSVLEILRFTIPAVGIWLCSPVLSTIDTAAVGLLGGTAQQAALNPAVSVTDYGGLVVAFMYTATTNLIAAAVREDEDDARVGGDVGGEVITRPKTIKTLVTALRLALAVGASFGLVLSLFGPAMLRLLIGNDSLDPEVFSAASRYVRIRALGMPAAVVIGAAQSACLGMQDVKSPLYVLAAAAGVNFVGDACLVPLNHVWAGGAAGAAWATVASQYAALAFFARWLTTSGGGGDDDGGDADGAKGTVNEKMRRYLSKFSRRRGEGAERDAAAGGSGDAVVDVSRGIMELTGTSKAGKSRRKEFRKFLASSKLARKVRRAGAARTATSVGGGSATGEEKETRPRPKSPPKTRGLLSRSRLDLRTFLSPLALDRTKAREFLPFVVPVTTTSVGRISGYVAMAHVASSALGTSDMAGHQIVFSIFCCLTPFVDALGQVAQSFVPGVFEAKEPGRERVRADALRKTVANFRAVGAGFGAFLVGLVACLPSIGRCFTTDPAVLERVAGAAPGVGLFMLVNGLMCAGEGTLLGQKDLKFLRNAYAVFFFAVPAYMLRLKRRALAGVETVGIGTMWAAFSCYNVIRMSIWHLRLAQLQRRTDRAAGNVSPPPEEGR